MELTNQLQNKIEKLIIKVNKAEDPTEGIILLQYIKRCIEDNELEIN